MARIGVYLDQGLGNDPKQRRATQNDDENEEMMNKLARIQRILNSDGIKEIVA